MSVIIKVFTLTLPIEAFFGDTSDSFKLVDNIASHQTEMSSVVVY